MMKTRYHVVFALSVLFCGLGCYRISPEEEKIIGTWEFTGLDATGRVVFRRDHTVVDLFPEEDRSIDARWIPLSAGKWRLEGNEIVTDEQALPIPGISPSERRITRMPIREFHEDRLVREENRPPFRRVNGIGELYAEILALLYVTSSLIALSVCAYAIRNSAFRKEFIVLAIAAVVSLAYSSLLLIAELAQTGSLVVSLGPLRSLKLPREILKLLWIVIVTVAFVRFAFALSARRPNKDL